MIFVPPDPELLYLPAREFLGKPLSQVLPEEAVRIINYTLVAGERAGKISRNSLFPGIAYRIELVRAFGSG